jgi:type IV pilus assembly protein PilA
MFRLIRKRMKGEKGFTLIELLVVIIIIAILAAIAIPTFLGQRNKAYDASAKSLVRNAMTAIETTYVDSRDFTNVTTGATKANLESIEPAITFTVAAIAAYDAALPNQVFVYGVAADTYSVGATSKSGKVFSVAVNKATGVTTWTPAPW